MKQIVIFLGQRIVVKDMWNCEDIKKDFVMQVSKITGVEFLATQPNIRVFRSAMEKFAFSLACL